MITQEMYLLAKEMLYGMFAPVQTTNARKLANMVVEQWDKQREIRVCRPIDTNTLSNAMT